MPCEVCEKIELEILVEEEDITLDVDFAGEFISGATGEEYQKGYDEGYIDGVEDGKQSAMTMANYAYKAQFASDDWATSDTVVLDMPNLSTMQRMFECSFYKIKHFTINSDTPVTNLNYAFGTDGNDVLKTVVLNIDTSKCTSFGQLFFKSNVKRIEGNPIDFSSATTIGRPLAYTYLVEYFRVVPNTIKIKADFGHSQVFDDETIQSIIDGLADLTGSTTQILTVHPNVKARIEANPVWLATIVGKNWTLT